MKYLLHFTIIAFILLGCSTNNNQVKNGEYKLIEIPSPSLKNAIIDAKDTQIVGIYLPPSYHMSNKSYPVVYNLTGFTVHPGEFPPTQWIDSLMRHGFIEEMIFVEISGYNLFQGTMYANSSVTGNWEDFVTKDVIHYIDHTYRTIPHRESRGIAGHSMGGGGCFNISLKHADKYAVAYPMSPAIAMNDSLVDLMFDTDSTILLLDDLTQVLNGVENNDFQTVLSENIDTSNFNLLWLLGYGSAFSENIGHPLRFDMPYFIDENGNKKKDEEIYESWQNGFSNLDLKIEKYKNNLLSYRHYSIDCGYYDEIDFIRYGTKHAIDLFEKHNIPLSVHWYNGDHVNRVGEQMANRMMPIMSAYLMKE